MYFKKWLAGWYFRSISSHRFQLEDLEQGLSIMRDKTEEYGKIMIKMR